MKLTGNVWGLVLRVVVRGEVDVGVGGELGIGCFGPISIMVHLVLGFLVEEKRR